MSTKPNNPEAESVVLGTVLDVGRTALDRVRAVASNPIELFADLRNRELWARIEKLDQEGRPIESAAIFGTKVMEELEAGYISAVANDVLPVDSLAAHVGVLWECQTRRSLIEASRRLTLTLGDLSTDMASEVAGFERKIFAAQRRRNPSPEKKDALGEIISEWEWAATHPGEYTGIPSGFVSLDKMTWGFQRQDLVVIAARPNQGKTAICCNVAAHSALNLKIPTLIFSFESSAKALYRRIVCASGRINGANMRSGTGTQDDFNHATEIMPRVNRDPIFIEDDATLTVAQMRSTARAYVKDKGVQLIVLDYLQKIPAARRHEKRTYEIAEISSGLKAMAKELDIPVIAAAQLNRDSDKEQRFPRMSDIGESGQIERDADVIALLHRLPIDKQPPGSPGVLYDLLLSKHRDGPIGVVPLTLLREFTRFESRFDFPAPGGSSDN